MSEGVKALPPVYAHEVVTSFLMPREDIHTAFSVCALTDAQVCQNAQEDERVVEDGCSAFLFASNAGNRRVRRHKLLAQGALHTWQGRCKYTAKNGNVYEYTPRSEAFIVT